MTAASDTVVVYKQAITEVQMNGNSSKHSVKVVIIAAKGGSEKKDSKI